MAFQEHLKNHESKNIIDRTSEIQKLQSKLDTHMPEQSKKITEQLAQLSPETFAQVLPQIQKQLSILQGKQEFSNRKVLSQQINILNGKQEESLPDFNLA
ncbi:MAG: hypothetical protein PHU93_01850 [Candidatus Gracilibacteria bacterium]|nr:hypothetical protein [Candidatus Gracilibacteria bacterium]